MPDEKDNIFEALDPLQEEVDFDANIFDDEGDLDVDFSNLFDLDEMYGGEFDSDSIDDGVVDRIEKISDALAEDIVISNTLEQIEHQDDVLGFKQNYIELFINKYANMWLSIDLLDGDDKLIIRDITERLITTVLEKIEEKYGVTLDVENIENSHYLDETLKNLAAVYDFFVLRNVQNIIDLFLNELEDETVLQPFVQLLSDEEYQKDLFIQSDLKKGLDPKIAAVTHFTHDIIDTLATNDADSLYALINRIIKLDLYEETNLRMYELMSNFGSAFQIVPHDSEAGQMYFNILYNDTVKAYVANQIITQYTKKHLNV